MGKRKKLGLSFLHYKNSGVINYLYSIIKALNTLPDEKKPVIVVFYYEQAAIAGLDDDLYPYLHLEQTRFEMGPLNRIKQQFNLYWLKWKGAYYFKDQVDSRKADCIYPMFPYEAQFERIRKKIHWMVDFNYRHLRQNYTEADYAYYTRIEQEMIDSGNDIVVSSQQVLNDLRHFHPHHAGKTHLLRFTAVLPDFEEVPIGEVRHKYGISGPYLITPNQFWPHKNHSVLLEAALRLRARGHVCQIVCTGNTRPGTDDTYFQSLQAYVTAHGLQETVLFLGSIDRREQLQLVRNALAIVQPSLFEGWSTLIEEGKALNQYMVVSDIPIHREQIDYNCAFFNPADADELSKLLETVLLSGVVKEQRDYSYNIRDFANRICEMIG